MYELNKIVSSSDLFSYYSFLTHYSDKIYLSGVTKNNLSYTNNVSLVDFMKFCTLKLIYIENNTTCKVAFYNIDNTFI